MEPESTEHELGDHDLTQSGAPPISAALVLLAWAALVYASYVLAYVR